jgi:hypothetical protein
MNVQVGKAYQTRTGRKVQIIASFRDINGKTCFRGDNGWTYGSDGKINPNQSRVEDLVTGTG